MTKYRHRVTGRVREVSDSYAKAVSALEPVSDDTEGPSTPCIPCGPPKPAGVGDEVSFNEEPASENTEGETFSWQS